MDTTQRKLQEFNARRKLKVRFQQDPLVSRGTWCLMDRWTEKEETEKWKKRRGADIYSISVNTESWTKNRSERSEVTFSVGLHRLP